MNNTVNTTSKEIEHVNHDMINKLHFFVVRMNYCGTHLHRDIEFLLQLDGKAHIVTPAEEFEIEEGDLVLFNANEVHAIYSLTADSRSMVLQIDPSFCQSYFPSIQYYRFLATKLTQVVPPRELEQMKRILFNAGYNFIGHKPGFEFRCMSDVNRLFSFLSSTVPYRVLSDDETRSSLSFERRMERILTYMHKHYTENLSLSEIAKMEGLTPSYLSHFFKDNLRQNFQEYLNQLRFEHALYLLQKTDLRITDIYMQSGFSDSKYMSKMFHKIYGMTPKEYRKRGGISNGSFPPWKYNAGKVRDEYIYSIPESLKILREKHTFNCDQPDHPLHITDM